MSVYNAESFLEDCLESILSQSYSNWELLVADDFSDDLSRDILTKFEGLDKRIKIYQHPEKGLVNALTYLEQHISGKFVTRMDADDIMPETKLDNMIQKLHTLGEGHIVTGKVSYFSSGKELNEGYLNYEKWLNTLVDKSDFWNDLYKECVIASPNWMIHKTDLDKCGGICSGIYPEDYDLCFRWYEKGIKVIGLNEVTHLWRDHDSRTSRTSELYRNNTFLELKARYFGRLEAPKFEQIILMGAGKKGKLLAQYFNELEMDFVWLSNNKKKTGHIIHGHQLQDVASFKFEANTAVIIATTQDREEISDLCSSLQLKPYSFC